MQGVIAQEAGIWLIKIQGLNQCEVLMKFDSNTSIDEVKHDLFHMETWMGMPCEVIHAIQDAKQMWVHRECEWVAPRDNPEWINDDYRDHLGAVDRVSDRVGWINPDNYSVRNLIADLNNNSRNRRYPHGTPRFGIHKGEHMRGDVAKWEVSYDQWTFEMNSVRDCYPENIMKGVL